MKDDWKPPAWKRSTVNLTRTIKPRPLEESRTYAYARASEDVENERYCLEGQLARLAKWVTEECGRGQVPKHQQTFWDEDQSAWKRPIESRAGGRALLSALKPGDHLVVTNLDRLCRSLTEMIMLLDDATKAGIVIHAIDFCGQEVDFTSPLGKLIVIFLAWAAEYESLRISQRTKAAMAHMKKMGMPLNGNPPFGFMFKNDRVVPHLETYKLMEQLHQWRREGKTLKACGQIIKQHHAKLWNSKSYDRITVFHRYKRWKSYAEAMGAVFTKLPKRSYVRKNATSPG